MSTVAPKPANILNRNASVFVGITLPDDDLEPKAEGKALHLAYISLLAASLSLPGREPGIQLVLPFSFMVSHKSHAVLEIGGVSGALSPSMHCSTDPACTLSCTSKLL